MTTEQRTTLQGTVADLIGRTIDNWNGYNRQRPDLLAEIASRLDAAGLLQSPETAAEAAHLRKERDAFREQRNGVYATNERLHAEVLESDQARLHAENDTRTVRRELAQAQAKFADAAATVAQLVLDRGKRMKVENAVRDELAQAQARVAELERAQAGLDRLAADVRAAAASPDPEHTHNTVMARGHMDEPLGYYICGICGTPRAGGAR